MPQAALSNKAEPVRWCRNGLRAWVGEGQTGTCSFVTVCSTSSVARARRIAPTWLTVQTFPSWPTEAANRTCDLECSQPAGTFDPHWIRLSNSGVTLDRQSGLCLSCGPVEHETCHLEGEAWLGPPPRICSDSTASHGNRQAQP